MQSLNEQPVMMNKKNWLVFGLGCAVVREAAALQSQIQIGSHGGGRSDDPRRASIKAQLTNTLTHICSTDSDSEAASAEIITWNQNRARALPDQAELASRSNVAASCMTPLTMAILRLVFRELERVSPAAAADHLDSRVSFQDVEPGIAEVAQILNDVLERIAIPVRSISDHIERLAIGVDSRQPEATPSVSGIVGCH